MNALAHLPFVVVLAGGEGTRLAALTRALYGVDLPKQFAVLDGDRSLLQQTLERAARLTTPERILVVATAQREHLARAQLAPYPGVELVVQPRNLDTGPGMLLPLVRVLSRAPDAHVIFLPSDHHVEEAAPLLEALAATAEGALRARLTLIGVAPAGPELEYGWITRGARIGRTAAYEVARFAEKPSVDAAEALWRGGALWNTFISTGPARGFWALGREHLPAHAAILARYAASIGAADEPAAMARAYATMTAANFSQEVFAPAAGLAVLPVAGTGWSDWGSPSRVFASLAGTPGHARLVARIRGAATLAS